MLYESFFENKTKGLIQGYTALPSNVIGGGSLIIPGKRNGSKFLNNKEFFVQEKLVDLRPSVDSIKTYKIVIRSRETKEEIWVRPFVNKSEAFLVWARLLSLDLERTPQVVHMPSMWIEGDLEYVFATVETFTSGSTTWTSSANPYVGNAVNVVVVAGGAGGASGFSGSYYGGGGGAGGYRNNTAYAVTKSTGYTVAVGAGGGIGVVGGGSIFGTLAASRGGNGGNGAVGAGVGGSGGGGSLYGTYGTGNLGAYTPPEGYRGGSYFTGGLGAPGGGSAGAGSDTSPSVPGPGTTNTISGASVVYAQGGYGSPQGTPLTNGGYGGYGGYTGQAGSTGVVVISYSFVGYMFNMPMLGM